MSSSIEDRIVAMKMENTQFEKGVSQSLASLTKLENALNKGISAKGLDDVKNSVGRFNLNPMEHALSGISKSWVAMSTIAITALAQVTSSVITTGSQMVKSLTLDPILQGFNEYSTNLTSIQTVLANTQAQGTTLDDVNKALEQLNNYSDKTIYNFGEMAKNIGTFTAAGVSLEGSVESIKGIANLAALSGSSSEQASTAMYQLSQAIASGRVSLQDWNSVVNAGMGGSTFQRALAQTAQAMGTIEASAIKIDEETGKMTINGASFRDSISAIGGEKWLTSDVLTNTLAQFTGDLTDAELAAQGFNDAQIKAIQQTAKTAQDAATKVKTIKQVFDVAKETIGSGWARTFTNIFGDFEQARTTMTKLSGFIGEIINKNADARNKVLKDWAKLNGRVLLIQAIKNAWEALMSVVGPIKDAFREIFPAKTGKDLKDITKSLNKFFKAITLSADAQENLKDTFAGFFAVIHIGYSIVKGVLSVLGTLLGLFVRGQGSTLAFTGSIGEMLVALDKFLTGGDRMQKFFDGISAALRFILEPLMKVRDALINAFTGLVTGNPAAFFDGISDAVDNLLGLVDSLSDKFADVVNTISDSMGGLGHISGFNLAGMFGGFGTPGSPDPSGTIDKIAGSIKDIEGPSDRIRAIWDKISGVWSSLGNFFQPLIDQIKTAGSAIGSAFGDLFSGAAKELDFTDFLNAVNTGLFLAIFLTFRRFTTGVSEISKAASGVLDQVTSNLKTMQNQVRADMIFKIAASLLVLSAAVFLLAKTDPKSLGIALGAVVVMLTALVVAMKILEKEVAGFGNGAKLIAVSTAMVVMSVAIAALAGAVFLFSKMGFKETQKGLLAVLESIALLTAAAVILTKSGAGANMIGAAAGLLIMSAALLALVKAIKVYGKMDLGQLLEGLAKVGIAIAVLGISMTTLQGSLGGAIAAFIIAQALDELAASLKTFASMSKGDLAKSLIALTAALLILAGGMALMAQGLPGAAALLVMTFALAALVPVIVALSQLEWSTVAKGIGIFILAAAGLAIGSVLLIPVVPILLGLAAAIVLVGAGVFLAGEGVLLFAKALEILSKTGEKGGDTLIDIFDKFMDKIGDWLDKANDAFPKFVDLLANMITLGLQVLQDAAPEFFETGFKLLIGFLNAFAENAEDIVKASLKLARNLQDAIGKRADKFAKIGLQALIDIIGGLNDAIDAKGAELEAAGEEMAYKIGQGLTSSLKDIAAAAVQGAIDGARGADRPSNGGVKAPPQTTPSTTPRTVARASDEMRAAIDKLIGGSDQVKGAFDDIEEKIENGLDKVNSQIEKGKDKLEKLRKQGKGESKEAKALEKELAKQRKLRDQLQQEQKKWNNKMKDERKELLRLSKEYDNLMAEIEKATDALEKAQSERDNFVASTQASFDQKPDISAGMSLQTYMRQIQKKTEQTKKFMETLQALRAAGLSDASYEQLLAEGVDAQKLMEQMLQGGGQAIQAFNAANAAMTQTASSLASNASTALYYDAAVASAQATLDGWESQLPALEHEMTKVARIMIKAIKKALGIKSPSREFREVADFTTEGFVDGLVGGISAVERASERVGRASLETLRATMNKASGMGVLDMTPTIAPVLDLAQLQKDAVKIGTMLATEPLVASVSYEKAAGISADQQAALEALDLQLQGGGDTNIDYTQILQSPKAISPIDTYRATKSAIPLIKEALDV